MNPLTATAGVQEEAGFAPVEIEYYTDPLCSWSWAFEPQWRRLRYTYGDRLTWRYRMGGMIADWRSYDDPLNSVRRPVQMGPVWLQVHYASGMPLDDRIWFEDPPESSYPACLAFKAAEYQSQDLAERYLRRIREAVMTERRNIARREVLLALAAEVDGLDAARLASDLDASETLKALRDDIAEARLMGIERFPALTMRQPGSPGVVMIGYRPYLALEQALLRAAPGITPVRTVPTLEAYQSFWGSLTPREYEEVADARDFI